MSFATDSAVVVGGGDGGDGGSNCDRERLVFFLYGTSFSSSTLLDDVV